MNYTQVLVDVNNNGQCSDSGFNLKPSVTIQVTSHKKSL